MQNYKNIIQDIWDNSQDYLNDPVELSKSQQFLLEVLNALNKGQQRACFKQDNTWHVNEYIKKAILLYFKFSQNKEFNLGALKCYDKIPSRFDHNSSVQDFENLRIVPNTYIRNGVFLGRNVIVMPSFINIGAYIDDTTMIDSMTTIGSCAQIGKRCHIASGVTIGGVLEPISHKPVIIEDDCFIGAGAQISEGVLVEEGAVVASGVILSSSVKIYNRQTKEITYGVVPKFSVVVPGVLPSTDGALLSCCVIVKTVDSSTRAKTAINELLRV